MSIEVRCPTPTCGTVHQVKTKYAGKRGKCPSCGGWMMIPALGPAPVHAGPPLASPILPLPPAPAPPPPVLAPLLGLDETTLWMSPEEPAPRHRPPIDDDATVIEVPEEVPTRSSRASGAPPKRRRLEPAVADEVIEDADLEEDEPAPRKSTRRFSWLVCAMLFFATLALGAGSVVPHVEAPSANATGPLKTNPEMQALKPYVPDDYLWPVTIAPASVALLAVLGLMVAMGTRNFGIFPMLTAYLAALTTVAGLALAIASAFHVQGAFADMEKQAALLGKEQKVTLSWGLGPPVALIGGGTALFLFSVSLLLMHRRAFTRILFVLVMLLACGGGVVVILTNSDLPPNIRSLWGS